MARGHLHKEARPRSAAHHLGFFSPVRSWVSEAVPRGGMAPHLLLPAPALCQTLHSSAAWVGVWLLLWSFCSEAEAGAGGTETWLSTAQRDLTAWTMMHFIIYLESLFCSNKFKIGGNPNEGSRVVFLALSLWKQFPLLASSKQKQSLWGMFGKNVEGFYSDRAEGL